MVFEMAAVFLLVFFSIIGTADSLLLATARRHEGETCHTHSAVASINAAAHRVHAFMCVYILVIDMPYPTW